MNIFAIFWWYQLTQSTWVGCMADGCRGAEGTEPTPGGKVTSNQSNEEEMGS